MPVKQLLFIFLMASSFVFADKKEDKQLEKARKYESGKEYFDALKIYEQLHAEHPEKIYYLYQKNRILNTVSIRYLTQASVTNKKD